MYLKRMELFGFKSFAEKTELHFTPGIVAIIGPNGCGKSNLVDAVRWALGEQSVKLLRGNRMEEVIFSGSASRKALNFAEVSLTFTGAASFLNLDYDEVTITRRLFRSGESEYLINKSACRLKDITELFLDTGIGKDIYSVIGQGRVEEIINSKPEDRREIFEEAAGILKYKLRKKEAQRRLEETRENLVRVQDLIIELETQVEPMQEQAAVARRYRAIKEQKEHLERQLMTYRINRSREQLSLTERQLQKVNDALAAAAAEGAAREASLQEIKGREAEELQLQAELERQLNRLSREIEQQEGELRLLQERKTDLQEQLGQIGSRREQLDAETARARSQLASLEDELAKKREAVQEERAQRDRLQEELAAFEKSALFSEVEAQQSKLYQARTRYEAAVAAVAELNQQLERLQRRKADLKESDAALKGQLARLLPRRQELEARLQACAAEAAEAGKKLAQAEAEQKALQAKGARCQQELQQGREELRGVNSRLQLLQEQEAGMSGYYRGVREVLQARPAIPGIIGPVVDLIAVEDRYLRSIETALGGGLQFIVTNNEDAAKEAIRYLKEGGRGWATFLPLDTLRPPRSSLEGYPGWRELEGVIGKATELVDIDPAYAKAVQYLLDGIAICRDLEAASRLARFVKHSCRVITLEGDVINPGGALRGGSVPRRNAAQPLGRRKEIEALEREQRDLQQKIAAQEETIKHTNQALARSSAEIERARGAATAAAEELHKARRALEELQQEEKFLAEQCRKSCADLAGIEEEKEELKQRLAKNEQDRDNHLQESAVLEQELAGKKELYQRSMERKKELDAALTEALVQLNTALEQERSLAASINRLQEELARLQRERSALEAQEEKIKKALAANAEAQKGISAALDQLHQQSAWQLQELGAQRKSADAARAAIMELEAEEQRWRSRVNRLEKRERQLALDQAHLQADLNYQQLRYQELFRTAELLELDPTFENEACAQQIEALNEDLEAMGEVNLGAVEELARLQERIDFLKSQQDDLRKGEQSLRKVLAEIDQRMEHYFITTFEVIHKNMQQVFTDLFQGGQVLLKLTDPDNVLESGIEISAQPPGKKLQNISLLSTGEKVLTALSLLFAILKHKPAPFYLLDEIESALDDVNLTRFVKYLKQAAAGAQFILITHRKRTMEEADVLYGVTMPESGVSKVVSLKLDQVKDERAS